jgi:hypothetical protein
MDAAAKLQHLTELSRARSSKYYYAHSEQCNARTNAARRKDWEGYLAQCRERYARKKAQRIAERLAEDQAMNAMAGDMQDIADNAMIGAANAALFM